jgi:hypothetical protein
MSRWVPFTLFWDDLLPVDKSFVFAAEKLASKHGFLTAKGDQFAFLQLAPSQTGTLSQCIISFADNSSFIKEAVCLSQKWILIPNDRHP